MQEFNYRDNNTRKTELNRQHAKNAKFNTERFSKQRIYLKACIIITDFDV